MAHIGVDGLTPRDRQKGGAQDGKSDRGARLHDIGQRTDRTDGRQNGRLTEDPQKTQDPYDDEPDQHDR